MTKRTKILALILSLALILGAVAVVAFSAVTGLNETYKTGFENAALATGLTANGTFDSYSITTSGRNGNYSIEQNPYDNNKYFRFNFYDEAQTGAGSYIYKYLVGNSKPLSTYSYNVLDFDFWTPTGTVKHGMGFQLLCREVNDTYNGNGSSDEFTTALFSTKTLYIGETNSENYLWFGGSSTVKVDLDESVWNHVTMVFETYGGVNSLHIYLNGEYAFSADAMISDTLTESDLSKFYLETIRINFPQGTADDAGKSIALDNIEFNNYTTAYTGAAALASIIDSKASLTSWSEAVYTEDYVMPFTTPVAEVGGVKYDNLTKAISAAEEGDTITLFADAGDFTVSKRITIDTAGYSVGTVSCSAGLSCYRVGNYYKVSSDKLVDSGYVDFEEQAEGDISISTSTTPSVGDGADLISQGVTDGTYGQASIVKDGCGAYLEYIYSDVTPTVAKTPYISKYITAKHAHSEVAYITLDYDMFIPTGKLISGMGAYFTNRTSVTDGTGNFGTPALYYTYDSATGKNYVGKYNTKNVELESDAWSHITMLLRITTDSSGYTITPYLFVNGEFGVELAKVSNTDVNNAIHEVRVQMPDSTVALGGASVAYDNISVRTFLNGYDDTTLASVIASEGSLSAWEDSGYDESSIRFGNAIAEVGGVEYDTLSDAVAAARAGDVITILKNNTSSVTVSKRLKIDTQGYTTGTVTVSGSDLMKSVNGNIIAITGIYTDYGILDFESTATGTYDADGNGVAANASASFGSGYLYLYGQRKGEASILDSAREDNRYFVYSWETGASSNGEPYVERQLCSVPSNSTAPNSLSEFPIHVVDVDLYLPSGKVADNAAINFVMRYANTAGGYGFFHPNNNTARLFYDDATGRSFFGSSATDTSPLYLDTNAWNHITVACVAEVSGSTYKTAMYVWVNGEGAKRIGEDTSTHSDMVALQAQVQAVRINLATNASADITSGAQLAVDNLGIRGFASDYTGNLWSVIESGSDITDWTDNVFDSTYTLPFGTPVAEVGGVEYDSVEAAISAAEAGDTVVLVKSIPDPVVLNKEVTLNTAGFTVGTITGAGGIIPVDNGDGTVSGVDVATSDYNFEYVSGGAVKYADSSMTFQQVLSAADANSTIRFLKDYTIESSLSSADLKENGIGYVNKNLTWDLDGNTFSIRQMYEDTTNSGQATISIAAGATLNVMNGTLTAGFATSSQAGTGYNFFQFVGNGTLNLTDVNSYVAVLVHSYGTACTVNIEGGEHHAIMSGYGGHNGFVRSYSKMNFTANNANFYVGDKGRLVSASLRFDAAGTASASYIFNNCNIVSTKNGIVDYSNNDITIEFNNCAIAGNITAPSLHAWCSATNHTAGYVTLGEGTVISGTYDTTYVVAKTGYAIEQLATSKDMTFSISSGNMATGLTIAEPTTNTYNFVYKVKVPDAPYTVSWYDEGGTLITTTEVEVGKSAVAPSHTPTVVADGWYKIAYDAWSTSAGGAATDNFTVNEDTSFYAVSSGVKPYLTAAKFNLKLMGHVQMNFYVPKQTPSYVSFTGVYNSAGAAIATGGNTTLSDVAYNTYVAAYVGASSLHNDTRITVKYTVTLNEVDYELTQTVTLSPVRYAKAVLADYDAGTGNYEAKAYGIVANMLRYSKAVHSVNGSSVAVINELVNKYESKLCDPIDNATDTDFPESGVLDIGDLSTYLNYITFEISSYEPRFKIAFKNGARVTGFRMETLGFNASSSGRGEYEANWSLQTYTFSPTWGVYYRDSLGQYVYPSGKTDESQFIVVNENGVTQSGATKGDISDKILGVVYTQNIPIYNVTGDMTVYLTLEDGSEVKGEYNIDTYYNGIKNTAEATALSNARYFLKAMRDYSEAVIAYRFPVGKFPSISENPETGEPVVYANQFGAAGDGVTDDYAALKRAFDFANSMGYDVIVPEGNYFVGNTCTAPIAIKTNVDFTDATFTFGDSEVGINDAARLKNIFHVKPDSAATTVTSGWTSNTLAIGATNIGYAPGYPALVEIWNENNTYFNREGVNTGAQQQREIVLVDKDGNVDPSTPIFYEYEAITKMVIRRVDDEPITITGGLFITDANAADGNDYKYYSRGIAIERSNVTVDGLVHEIINEGETGAPYSGFLSINNSYNVRVQNSTLQGHKAYCKTNESTGVLDTNNTMGTYDISVSSSSHVTFYNVQQSNFFAPDGTLPVNGTPDYDYTDGVDSGTKVWGIMGSNFCKNITYDTCTLSRFDAHCGLVNGKIINSQVSHISIIGGGDMIIQDSTIYGGTQDYIINLRSDYGSTWRGTISVTNVDYMHTTDSDYIQLVIGYNKTSEGWDYGYTCYIPVINVNGMHTYKYTDGNPVKDNQSDKALAFLTSMDAYNTSGTSAQVLWGNTNGVADVTVTDVPGVVDMSDVYLPRNRNGFVNGLTVSKDGTTVDIHDGTHTDVKRGDKVCDTCGAHYICSSAHSSTGTCSTCGTTITSDSSSDNCVTGDTLVMLADGSEARIDSLTGEELVMVFDHYTGELSAAPIVWYANDGVADYEVVTLTFSDGTVTKLIDEHGYFNKTLNKYVYIHSDDAESFVGDEFAIVGDDGTVYYAALVSAETSVMNIGCYSITAGYHYGFITDGVLSMPGGIDGIFNIFEYGDDLKYDEEKMAEDIETYGIFTYEELADYGSYEMYEIFNAKYFKVAIGKGMTTLDEILGYISAYL